VHADRSQSVADLIELEWLDNGHDDFHEFQSPLGPGPAGGRFRRLRSPTQGTLLPRGTAQPRVSSRVPVLPKSYKRLKLQS
jgi:hypothetical protein